MNTFNISYINVLTILKPQFDNIVNDLKHNLISEYSSNFEILILLLLSLIF